jgi:hypothetical protein
MRSFSPALAPTLALSYPAFAQPAAGPAEQPASAFLSGASQARRLPSGDRRRVPDEGHAFARAENRVDFNARAELFLKQSLGGRAAPLSGERIPGSTGVVKVVEVKPASQAAR